MALSLIVSARSAEAPGDSKTRLEAWRKQSPAHEAAHERASSLFLAMTAAAYDLAAENQHHRTLPQFQPPRATFSRRAVLAGGFAGAAAAAAVIIWPPLDLWPSLEQHLADYHTVKGQRQTVRVSAWVQVELNTRSSINVGRSAPGTVIKLVEGEAAIVIRASGSEAANVHLVAENGSILASEGSFSVRTEREAVRVACLEGSLTVQCGGQQAVLPAQSEVRYSAAGLEKPARADVAALTAWRQGLLLFHNEPLQHVVEEINRYRPGRVVLLNGALGQRRITARLQIDALDEIFPLIQNTLGSRVHTLPGGIALLS